MNVYWQDILYRLMAVPKGFILLALPWEQLHPLVPSAGQNDVLRTYEGNEFRG